MRNNFLSAGGVLALALCWMVPESQAQTGFTGPATAPGNRPAVSPYLNLTRPGNVGLNYYNLVRPEFDFYNGIDALQTQVGRQGTTIQNLREDVFPVTGHATSFMNLTRYYGRGFGSPAGTAGPLTAPATITSGRIPTAPTGTAPAPALR